MFSCVYFLTKGLRVDAAVEGGRAAAMVVTAAAEAVTVVAMEVTVAAVAVV